MKELPKVFANPIEKKLNNNRSVSYDRLNEEKHSQDLNMVKSKINKLFSREGNIYSIDCLITFENACSKFTIIGKTSNKLVTKTGKLIPMDDIWDIDLA